MNRRRFAMAAAFFCLGALPLLLYNIRRPLATFRLSGGALALDDVPGKSAALIRTLDGSSLFGYLVRDQTAEARGASSLLERASVRLSDANDNRQRNLLPYAFGLAVLALPLWWRSPVRRLILFAAIVFGIAWFQMLAISGAGGGSHHIVLLWPLPHLIIAAALGVVGNHGKAARLAIIALTAILVVSNLLVTNQYLSQLIRFGPEKLWTDAITPLSERLGRTPAREIFITDWGIFDSLRLLGHGRLRLRLATDQLNKPRLDEQDRAVVRAWLDSPEVIFVGHTDSNEEYRGANARLLEAAAGAGYRREMLARVADRHGREVFEVYRFLR